MFLWYMLSDLRHPQLCIRPCRKSPVDTIVFVVQVQTHRHARTLPVLRGK